MPKMLAPIGRRDFVFDQRVDSVGVGNAQQRFGQTHQRDAFVRRQAVFGKENLHQAGLGGLANAAHKLCRFCRDPGAILCRQVCAVDQFDQFVVFVCICVGFEPRVDV